MFKPEIRDGIFLGFAMDTPEAYFFFGGREVSRVKLPTFFPGYEFAFLKQVHGRAVVGADVARALEADAHFTREPNLALVAQTADCVPVLLAGKRTVCAIHSGWRGCAQDIVSAARDAFKDDSVRLAAIGPHIMTESFEVGLDVAARIEREEPGLRHPHKDPAKTYLDLTELVRRQLRKAFGSNISIVEALENTVTSPRFHSFRRDRERAERQYSFVVLKP
ncbi:MAG TPA: polyphenol oxidase family protein [Bdellovibrionales bacterium]|nr:polyphenol oxidase family protein [Bdellovibrionales bacterium]